MQGHGRNGQLSYFAPDLLFYFNYFNLNCIWYLSFVCILQNS